MCGIGGWFSPAPRLARSETLLQTLGEVLRHRGPDGVAALEMDHVGMVHRRLALIDLITGDQPMWSVDRRAVIVFNGEIFNYRELRRFYEQRGAVFASQSDTEVILAAYQSEGISGFGRLRGMFAFALWDADQRRALLVRDPFGIKPMFLHEGGDGTLRFASEAKGVSALLDASPSLDTGSLHALLNFRYVPGEATLFQGIRQLAPGECFEWRLDGKHRYTRLDPPATDISEGLRAALQDSVRKHLIADVPIGSYLSGGIDSGLIAAMARAQGMCLPTFTLSVGDDPAEARNAAETAGLLGLENFQAELANDEVSRLPRMLWHLETPKVNAVQLFRLAELARTQVKAVLSGVGGDELFAGYNVHRIFHFCTQLPAPAARLAGASLRHLLPAATVPFVERDRALEMGMAIGDWPKVYALLRNIWDRPNLRRWLYGPRMLDSVLPDAISLVRERWATDGSPLEAMMQFEWRNKMVNDLLWQEDRASMAAGLEVRVPFVDSAVQAAVKRAGAPRLGKAALREVAQDYLPGRVLSRPKSGFQLDAPAFFEANLRSIAETWLAPKRVREYGLFNPETTATLLRLPAHKRYRWHFFMLYLMIQTHMWIDIFERRRRPESLGNG